MRIAGIDLGRSFVAALAMLIHALIAFDAPTPAALLFRTATPTFMIMLGVFLELVYYRKIEQGRVTEVRHRLLTRSIQCAALHCMAAAVYCLSHGFSFAYFVRISVFLGRTPFTDILKFYAIALALAPLLLAVRHRFGLLPLIVVALALHPLLALIHWPTDMPMLLGDMMGLLFGAPAPIAGPSVAHAAMLIVFGMVIGRMIRLQEHGRWLIGGLRSPLLAAFVGLILAFSLVAARYPQDWVRHLGDMTMRNANHPLYFIYGALAALLILDLSMRLSRHLPDRLIHELSTLGRTSLFTFGFGNSALYLLMGPTAHPLAAALLAFAMIVCASFAYGYADAWAGSRHGRLSVAYRRVAHGYATWIAARLLRIAPVPRG